MLKVWTREILQEFVRTKLDGYRLIVVSNREPYQHRLDDGKITYSEPAGGVTAALDPVMRACGGLWIAHGSGDADRQVVDRRDHVAVPRIVLNILSAAFGFQRRRRLATMGGCPTKACGLSVTSPSRGLISIPIIGRCTAVSTSALPMR
jgi:trehalose-6-phosphate synthase